MQITSQLGKSPGQLCPSDLTWWELKSLGLVFHTKSLNTCFLLSLFQCPANDLLENARSKGVYQTMSTDAFLTIRVCRREDLLVKDSN